MAFDLDEAWVAKSEAALGARLPQAYRLAMMRENGGEFIAAGEEWQLHPILDGSARQRLARTCNDIVRETRVAAEWPGFPPHAVVIAANGSGDCVVFLRAGDEYGAAPCLWSHETRALARLADDFGVLVPDRQGPPP